jgi:hypothetical protein
MTRRWLQDWLMLGAGPGLTPGPAVRRWEPQVSDRTQPAASDTLGFDLRGRSLLHVACDAGALCLEALRRGASDALGVDGDPDRIRMARSYASLAELPARFSVLDVEEGLPSFTFDVVVCTDLSRFHDPVAMIDRLGNLTNERLVIEFEGLGSPGAKAYLDRIGAPQPPDGFDRLPAIVVTDDPASRAGAFLSPVAVESLLRQRSGRFSRVEVTPIGSAGRYRAVAERRRVSRLVIVAAPGRRETARTVRRIRSGKVPRSLMDRLDLSGVSEWEYAPDGRVPDSDRRTTPALVYGYDLHGPWRRRGGRFGADQLTDLVDSAAEVFIITSWSDPEVLQERGRARVGRASESLRRLERQPLRSFLQSFARLTRQALRAFPGRWTPSRMGRFVGHARSELDLQQRLLRIRALVESRQEDARAYRQTDEHVARYARWLDHCDRIDADGHWVVDASQDEWTVQEATDWGRLLVGRRRGRERSRRF